MRESRAFIFSTVNCPLCPFARAHRFGQVFNGSRRALCLKLIPVCAVMSVKVTGEGYCGAAFARLPQTRGKQRRLKKLSNGETFRFSYNLRTYAEMLAICFLFSFLPNAGISSLPFAMMPEILATLIWRPLIDKSGTSSCCPTGVSPLPSAPWQRAQLLTYKSFGALLAAATA